MARGGGGALSPERPGLTFIRNGWRLLCRWIAGSSSCAGRPLKSHLHLLYVAWHIPSAISW